MGEQQLAVLLKAIQLLESYAKSVRKEALESDFETWVKVRGALELAAQCCIDLALSIVATRGLSIPQTYREAFDALSASGIIEGTLAQELKGWAGLRNVLVHLYTALDLETVHRALSETAPLRAFHAVAAHELRRS